MQKVNVDVYIWNELWSNDRFGFNARSPACYSACYSPHEGEYQRGRPQFLARS